MTSISEVVKELINFDVKNDKIIFDHKNTCHFTFFIIYSKFNILE